MFCDRSVQSFKLISNGNTEQIATLPNITGFDKAVNQKLHSLSKENTH